MPLFILCSLINSSILWPFARFLISLRLCSNEHFLIILVTFLLSGIGAACFLCGDCWGLDEIIDDDEHDWGLAGGWTLRATRLAAAAEGAEGTAKEGAGYFCEFCRCCVNAKNADGSANGNEVNCGNELVIGGRKIDSAVLRSITGSGVASGHVLQITQTTLTLEQNFHWGNWCSWILLTLVATFINYQQGYLAFIFFTASTARTFLPQKIRLFWPDHCNMKKWYVQTVSSLR